MNVALSPIFNGFQFFDNDGGPLSGGKVFTYYAGSNSSYAPTWSDYAGTILNTNPIVLDSAGRMPVEMWLDKDSNYNLVLTKPDGTTILQSCDNVNGTTAGGGGGGGGTGTPPTLIAKLVGNRSATMNRDYMGSWTTTIIQASADSEWNGYSGRFVLNTPGQYRITITNRVDPWTTLAWPNQAIVLGTYVPNAIEPFNVSSHYLGNADASPLNTWSELYDEAQIVQFTDEFYVTAGGIRSVDLFGYGEMKSGAAYEIDFSLLVTIQRMP